MIKILNDVQIVNNKFQHKNVAGFKYDDAVGDFKA